MDQRGSTWINRLQRHGSRVMRPDSWLTCHAFSVLARGACVHALSPFSVMAHASCVQRPGSCVLAHASWLMRLASWLMRLASWLMRPAHASGSCVMRHASTLHAPRSTRPAGIQQHAAPPGMAPGD